MCPPPVYIVGLGHPLPLSPPLRMRTCISQAAAAARAEGGRSSSPSRRGDDVASGIAPAAEQERVVRGSGGGKGEGRGSSGGFYVRTSLTPSAPQGQRPSAPSLTAPPYGVPQRRGRDPLGSVRGSRRRWRCESRGGARVYAVARLLRPTDARRIA